MMTGDKVALVGMDGESNCLEGLFFLFQAEDGIRDTHSDWSSDVCSSDLSLVPMSFAACSIVTAIGWIGGSCKTPMRSEERRVGKSVVRCVDLGGRRII